VKRGLRNSVEKVIDILGDVTGLEPVRIKQASRGTRVLRRLSEICGPINTVIDVGASDGRWSQAAMAHWPAANYVLVEAQDLHLPALKAFTDKHPRVSVVNAAASDHVGTIHFDTRNPFGGEASTQAFAAHDASLPCTTIDAEIERRNLAGPYLIKLDTHGHEAQILKGAEKTLRNAGLLVIEAYNFAKPNRMFFWQLCALVNDLGFRVGSLADPLMAEDGVLRQLDLYFLPPNNKGFDRIE
jgi:FkbM family methyltransferase